MKFKITKLNIETILRSFPKNSEGYQEVELELVNDTASEAILRQNIENVAWYKGYHYGFKEGFYEGRKTENRYCKCGCGGNNCHLRFCDEFCPLYNK
jgi:hypothetical protein